MNKPPSVTKRRLAAIFCADVAGYARLMSTDEAGTLCLLSAHREIMDRQITQHDGRTANTAGDSIVAEFPSAVDAVRCAIDVQERIAAVNEDYPEERRIIFRIGVHVGEVLLRNGDLFGDGVNIAARMEKLAQPGLICLSGAAHEYVCRVLPLIFDDLGLQVVKNLSTPIRAYSIHPSGRFLSRTLPPVHRHNEFNLGRRFHRVLTTALMAVTKPERLTPGEPAVLASLHDAPGIDERRLAARIGIDLAKVQRMVKHLELRGLISQAEGATSRRACVFSLTPAGLELYSRLHPAILAVRDQVMGSLSEHERVTLQDLLARVISANESKDRRHLPGEVAEGSEALVFHPRQGDAGRGLPLTPWSREGWMRIEHDDENRPAKPDDLSMRLKALDTRISRAVATREKAQAGPSPKSDAGALGQALQLSAGFVSSVAAGGLIGWGLDWLLGSSPWGLMICLLLGSCAGMLGLLRAAATTKTIVP